MSDLVIFDTSVLIDDCELDDTNIECNRSPAYPDMFCGSGWSCGVVPPSQRSGNSCEHWPGTTPVLTPTEKNWLESGQILGRIHSDRGFTAGKLRDMHFDLLIALTARSYGARLITSNRVDFEVINNYRKVQLEIW